MEAGHAVSFFSPLLHISAKRGEIKNKNYSPNISGNIFQPYFLASCQLVMHLASM